MDRGENENCMVDQIDPWTATELLIDSTEDVVRCSLIDRKKGENCGHATLHYLEASASRQYLQQLVRAIIGLKNGHAT